MSVGAPRAELDAAKAGCTVYDVIMSTDAFDQIKVRGHLQRLPHSPLCLLLRLSASAENQQDQ